jgi:hypothetical protein
MYHYQPMSLTLTQRTFFDVTSKNNNNIQRRITYIKVKYCLINCLNILLRIHQAYRLFDLFD